MAIAHMRSGVVVRQVGKVRVPVAGGLVVGSVYLLVEQQQGEAVLVRLAGVDLSNHRLCLPEKSKFG